MDKCDFVRYVGEWVEEADDVNVKLYAAHVYDYFRYQNEHGRLNITDAHAVGEAYITATNIANSRLANLIESTKKDEMVFR